MILDVNISYADMPTEIRAYTMSCMDDSYIIILNSKMSREQHLLSYHHEMLHIERGDYEKQKEIGILELRAHAL